MNWKEALGLIANFMIPGVSHIAINRWKEGLLFLENWFFLVYISVGTVGDLFGIGAIILRVWAVWHFYKIIKDSKKTKIIENA